MQQKEAAIAVFDSGLGGISVLRELVRQMPHEHFLYYGDSKNAPYGSRTTQEVRELTFAAVERLPLSDCKALVVACNTATSAAIAQLRSAYPDRIIIGIEPALKLAVSRHAGGRILVMATDATLREQKFADLMARCAADCEISSLPCPGLVEYIERGILDGPELEDFLRARLMPYLSHRPDAVVLGCTHYPFVRGLLRRLFGSGVELLDGSEGTARETMHRLARSGLLRTEGAGSVLFRTSGDPTRMLPLSEQLLHAPD